MSTGEACGVIGVYAPGQRAANLIHFGLFALQHRGQESAGIAASDGETLTVYKDLGLVAQVFNDHSLAGLDGHVGIGHTRYSTTGSTTWENSQPVHRQIGPLSLALGHNGNLTNSRSLAASLAWERPATDSELMAEAISRAVDLGRDDALEAALLASLPTFEGAFSLVLMDQHRLVGVRDPNGFRPLSLGRLPEGEATPYGGGELGAGLRDCRPRPGGSHRAARPRSRRSGDRRPRRSTQPSPLRND